MRLKNLSLLHDHGDLQELIQFVTRYTEHHETAEIVVIYDGCHRTFATGIAYYDPRQVVLNLSNPMNFPKTSGKVVPDLPQAHCRDWRDEFVLVLAHELRHIEQYQVLAFDFFSDAGLKMAEVDAETFALAVLNEYVQEGRQQLAA